MNEDATSLNNLEALATDLRNRFEPKQKGQEGKKYMLLYAYNGIGKTRLSMAFKDIAKNNGSPDTLYFNAYTEDLFTWDNDLENDTRRKLHINKESDFFSGIQEQDMENKIRPLIHRYADFNFLIDYDNWTVNFIREVTIDGTPQNREFIKISRGRRTFLYGAFFLLFCSLQLINSKAMTG